MFNSPFSPLKAALLTLFAVQSTTLAQSVPVAIGEANGTQLGAGAFNATKDGLAAEIGDLWGVSNSGVREGMLYFVYADLAGSTLPTTIQPGTYVFEARIGNGSVFDFSGLNTPAAGNTSPGSVAGFFSTFENGNTGNSPAARTNAELTKNHMASEFNDLSGVTYTAPTEAAPADSEFTTWTFTWDILPESPVIGSNPFFAVYTSTGSGGAAFWDDSTLTFSPNNDTDAAILTFDADNTQVAPGDPVTLSWDVSNETSLTLDPGNINVFGTTSRVVNPIATTTYTLIASDGINTVQETIEITVSAVNPGNSISVNFHSDDSDALADHQLSSGELAGLTPSDGSGWNNINLGASATHGTETIFPPTQLKDDAGNTSAATLTATPDSTYFVGYAAGSASGEPELNLAENQDDLFNSYLALNGPSGDGSPADSALLTISGLGAEFTSQGYSLIIYSDSDITSGGGNRTSVFTLTPEGSSAITLLTEDNGAAPGGNTFDDAFIVSDGISDGADYSNFTFVENLTSASFTLEVTSPNGGRGAINGFQIIAGTLGLPEPAEVPVITSLTAADQYVQPNTPVVLTWEVTGAETLTLNPGNLDVTGQTSFSFTATATTTYTLTASSSEGSVSQELRIGVGPERPNILFCLVDDWGVMDTSELFSYDDYLDGAQPVARAFNDFYQTPNLEQLADDGIKFTQAYALPVCSPTRTSVMTGFNAPRHGVTVHINLNGRYERPSGTAVANWYSPNNWRFRGMEVTDVTLPRLLSEQGYRSIHCGKAHFGARGAVTEDPRAIGFDINLGGSGAGSPGRYIGNPGFSSGNNPVPFIEDYHGDGKYLTVALTEALNDAMEDAVDDGVPFFSYMSYYAVHSPFTTNPNATGDYSAAASNTHGRFASMVEGVDTSLGQIRAKLEELGVAENTLIVFTGDNGSDSPALRSRQQINNAFADYPIRGKKANCYEGGYHVPLFVAWGKDDPTNIFQQQLPIFPDTVEHDIVSVVDIPTTILSVADVAHPFMDGVDLSPYLTSLPGTHREQTLLRHQPNSHNSAFWTSYRRDDYKLIYFYYEDPANQFELYDLAADRDESSNLASSNPQLVLELAREMAQALDDGWGEYGELWPTNDFNGGADADRPFINDPFEIFFAVEGRDLVDSDRDGLADAIEDLNQNGLTDSTETNADNPDSDGDNNLDGAELRTGTNPLDANSFFSLSIEQLTANRVLLTWPSAPGASYDIKGSPDFSLNIDLEENFPASDTASSTSVEVQMPVEEARFFFQVELLP